MKRTTYFLPLCLFSAFALAEPQAAAAIDATPPDAVPLNQVIDQVGAALDQYQKDRGGGDETLPPLSSAEFDFKVATSSTDGVSFTFLIFKFGSSHENDVTNEITYTYSLPKPVKSTSLSPHKEPPSLKDQLAQTIQTAAKAIKQASKLGKLDFSKLTVNIQYGVKWDTSGGVQPTISLVTVGLNGDKNKNTVQSVKLVFGQ